MNSITKHLGEMAEIFAGISGLGDSGKFAFKVIQPNSFSDLGAIESIETQYHKEDIGKKLSVQAGDILVKRLNPSYVFVVSDDEAGAVASQNLLVVRPGPEIDPLYLACLLEQKEVISQVEHVSGTSAAIKAISQKKLAEIMIPVIPISDQKSLGEVWRLARKRKALLREYIEENDKLVSILVSKITTCGGKER